MNLKFFFLPLFPPNFSIVNFRYLEDIYNLTFCDNHIAVMKKFKIPFNEGGWRILDTITVSEDRGDSTILVGLHIEQFDVAKNMAVTKTVSVACLSFMTEMFLDPCGGATEKESANMRTDFEGFNKKDYPAHSEKFYITGKSTNHICLTTNASADSMVLEDLFKNCPPEAGYDEILLDDQYRPVLDAKGVPKIKKHHELDAALVRAKVKEMFKYACESVEEFRGLICEKTRPFASSIGFKDAASLQRELGMAKGLLKCQSNPIYYFVDKDKTRDGKKRSTKSPPDKYSDQDLMIRYRRMQDAVASNVGRIYNNHVLKQGYPKLQNGEFSVSANPLEFRIVSDYRACSKLHLEDKLPHVKSVEYYGLNNIRPVIGGVFVTFPALPSGTERKPGVSSGKLFPDSVTIRVVNYQGTFSFIVAQHILITAISLEDRTYVSSKESRSIGYTDGKMFD